MAAHKVPQDVEADDKFLGPLSFKQFIFFGIAVIAGYLTFLSITEKWYIVTPFVFIPFLIAGILAFPWSKEQPTELWLASRVRFFLKPRKRIWDQSGAKQLVNITVPKKEVFAMTDGLNQSEVRSRFNALATIVDSRGWAIKNISGAPVADQASDRLVVTASSPQSTTLVADEDDLMDNDSSPIARQFDGMIQQSELKLKSRTLELIEQARHHETPLETTNQSVQQSTQTSNSAQDFWFAQSQQSTPTPTVQAQTSTAPQPSQPTNYTPVSLAAAEPAIDETAFLELAHKKQYRDALQTGSMHDKVILPQNQSQNTPTASSQVATAAPQPTTASPQAQPVTQPSNPVILDLAKNNDLNIETLSRQAKKNDDNGEVVISLR